ncbi:undecaprenyldiphospho-muramoylpentapeptide beta-N-acetylglucosaminyltransferase [Methyloradius palustris]|nr:undecaprenyldiphospho-muramoylpentapeptide beta-N-acetylglucosaminyltransferase [Methyloradius palustris]
MAKTILIMAAGTGGHIMPGLAVAKAMQSRGWNVHWLGTKHGMENKLVPPTGIAMTTIDFSGLRGKGLVHTFRGVFKLLFSAIAAWLLMGRLRPQVILGMGGYVTVPGGWAARLRKLPLAVVNADAALLMSNKALVSSAQRILFGFDGEYARSGDLEQKARVTGNPVRAEINQIPSPELRMAGRTGPLKLLVVGGSLGAQALNDLLPRALSLLPYPRPVVTHQSGEKHIVTLQTGYSIVGVEAQVIPFIENMAAAYAEADLVICRAGAITVSELAVAGVASVLVPLVVSTTSHQRDNARWLAEHGAAIYLPQDELTADGLAELLRTITREQLLGMAQSARRLGKPQATDAIVAELEAIALPESQRS